MRLVSFEGGFGRIEGDAVVPMGRSILDHLAGAAPVDDDPVPLDALTLLAPVPAPGKVLCIGLNYRDHAAETSQALPDVPIVFAKYGNSVVGPGDDIVVPAAASGMVDYEAELAVVIGRRTRRVAVDDALANVAGYCCANDVSARSAQFRTSQWTMGKAVDTFLPLGPWLVTADEVPDPQVLGVRCTVNGELRQSSTTAEMVFGVAELVGFLSASITLEPGDVIATGTPPGVGMAMDPPRWLAEGDEVRVEIDGLGALVNRVRHEART